MLIALGFLTAFIWAVKSGQFEDTFTPSIRVLFEDKNNNKNFKNKSDSLLGG